MGFLLFPINKQNSQPNATNLNLTECDLLKIQSIHYGKIKCLHIQIPLFYRAKVFHAIYIAVAFIELYE